MKFKYMALCLIILCCLMGAASASEDISSDLINDSVDDVLITDINSDDSTDSLTAESLDSVSDNTNKDLFESDVIDSKDTNDINDEENTVSNENNKEKLNAVDEYCFDESDEVLSSGEIEYWGTDVDVYDWWDIVSYSHDYQSDFILHLVETEYEIMDSNVQITGCITIIGNDDSYITGSYDDIIFYSTGDYVVNFINVTFKNIQSDTFMKLYTSYRNSFENCTFINVSTSNYDDHSSVIWNAGGLMTMDNCKFINCTNGFGVITNYKNSTFEADMDVDNCTFINNFAREEPGAINNCGNLNVTDSNFMNNSANMWAGAIHTHYGANTIIYGSNFTNNFAGWNGGALYSYSNLSVYNSNFINNSCNKSSGGGAIGGSEWTSAYNILVQGCNFIDNSNICNLTNETPSVSNGGAISALGNGNLAIIGSNFTNNYAKYGQAISAYGASTLNPYNGLPRLVISSNNFLNHYDTNSDTVNFDGTYIFENNNFTNCYQVNRGGYNNLFINCTPANNENDIQIEGSLNKKISNKNILGDKNKHDIIFVNISKDGSDQSFRNDDVDGQSWENSYNGVAGLSFAIGKLNPEGTIYVYGYDYDIQQGFSIPAARSMTIIGFDKENTIFNYLFSSKNKGNLTQNLINLTFHFNKTNSKGILSVIDLAGNNTFTNCTFIDTPIDFVGQSPQESKSLKFINCEFINATRLNNGDVSSLIRNTDRYNSIEFVDCLFENLTYDSIFYSAEGQFEGVSIINSSFKNCNLKGIVDISGHVDIDESNCIIENCDYDFDANTEIVSAEDYTHNYVNATKLKVVAVDSAVDISSSEKGVVVISLTDGTNPIAGALVSYTVNDGEETNATTDENGKITIPNLSGEVTVAVNYIGNESYNPISDSKAFNFTEETVPNTTDKTNTTDANSTAPAVPAKMATKLTAAKVSAVYGVTKKLTITLKDKNGKALANKKVSVKVGSISKTLTTNKKGQVSLNVAGLVPKTYTAVVKFAGDNSYTASAVKPKVVVSKAKIKLAAKAKTFKVKAKTKKYTVSLKNNKGKVMKSTKLTLKIGKKTYTAKTNKKGVATFKVKLTKKGKNTAVVKFAGNKYFKALSKKVKIVVK